MIKNLTKKPIAEREEKPKSTEIESAQNDLSRALGTKVQILGSMSKGKIAVSYFNKAQLESLYDFIMTHW